MQNFLLKKIILLKNIWLFYSHKWEINACILEFNVNLWMLMHIYTMYFVIEWIFCEIKA